MLVNDLSTWMLIISWENWKSNTQKLRQILRSSRQGEPGGVGEAGGGKAGLQEGWGGGIPRESRM